MDAESTSPYSPPSLRHKLRTTVCGCFGSPDSGGADRISPQSGGGRAKWRRRLAATGEFSARTRDRGGHPFTRAIHSRDPFIPIAPGARSILPRPSRQGSSGRRPPPCCPAAFPRTDPPPSIAAHRLAWGFEREEPDLTKGVMDLQRTDGAWGFEREEPDLTKGVMDLQRTDGVSVHVSTQSNEVENVSSIVDWSKLVIEPEKDEDEEESLDEKGVPDEKPVNENAMFALLGLKTEADEDGMKLGPIVAPTPADLDDTKDVAILVDDMAQEEALIAWDERHPKMDIGTPYPDMAAFRKAIKQFAINGEFQYGTTKNEPARFRAFCKGQGIKGEPCQWCLSASWQRDQNCVMVVKHQTEHICSSTSGKVTSMTDQAWVAEKAAAMLKKDPTIGATKILHVLQDEYHITLDYHTVWKGKQKAATSLYGSWEESFRMLYNYKAEIELRSPGSIVEIDTTTVEGQVHFSRLFIAFKPCIDGFLNGCRPYISIDSTHLNGKWNGQLAVVTALDGHNWMFPVAYGFIESENGDNWAWFMNQVKKAIGDPPVLAVCTDACKGLENAVKKVFPQAEQRECFRHMYHNFRKYFHGDVFGRLWPAARAYRYEEYKHHMEKVFAASEKVHPYLRDYHSLLWMRCMFNSAIKCDYINNNLAECFNAWVRDIKDLPIVQLADQIREIEALTYNV